MLSDFGGNIGVDELIDGRLRAAGSMSGILDQVVHPQTGLRARGNFGLYTARAVRISGRHQNKHY